MRVIVTGSRTWTDREFLWGVLDALAKGAADQGYEELTVVHGACYPKEIDGVRPDKSADWLAHRWVHQPDHPLPVFEKAYPARWSMCAPTCPPSHRYRVYCPYAGFRRNDHMVSLGADFCAGFILPCADPKCRKKKPHGTHGASGCADLAEAAGVPTERWPKP